MICVNKNTNKIKCNYLRSKLSLSYIFEMFPRNMCENECRGCARFCLLFFVQPNSCFDKADNEEHKQDEDKDRQVRDAIIARSNAPAEGMWPPECTRWDSCFFPHEDWYNLDLSSIIITYCIGRYTFLSWNIKLCWSNILPTTISCIRN